MLCSIHPLSLRIISLSFYTVNEILKLCPADLLVKIYKIPGFEAAEDFLQKVATARGRLKKGGIVDVDASARMVLHDWNEGVFSIS